MNAVLRFFAGKPRLAFALAAMLVTIGLGGLVTAPIRLYPSVSAPTVTISCTYPGANSREVMNTVAGPIEDQVNGVENMIYMTSSCADSGAYSCTVTFEIGTDRDVALMKVQTLVQQAMTFLPQEVKNAGLTVSAGTPEDFATLTFRSPGRKLTFREITDYVYGVVQPAIRRVQGVGNAEVKSDKVAMRIWFDPKRMAALGISTDEAVAAIRQQNVQASLGSIGASPTGEPEGRVVSLIAKGRLSRTEEFEDIIIRTNADGGLVRLRDVGRIELGHQAYNYISYHGDVPAVQVVVNLFQGEDVHRTHGRMVRALKDLERDFPADLVWEPTYDATRFMYASLAEIARCILLGFAVLLLVVFAFLRDWRMTAVLALAVPVAVLPVFAVLGYAGESINVLTLIALFLSLGLAFVDCAAIAWGVSPGAVVTTAAVSVAAFLPIGAVTGLTGAIYRQFSLVLVSAAVFSAFVALSLVPVLVSRFGVSAESRRGMAALERLSFALVGRKGVLVALLVLMGLAAAALARMVPATLIPDEDTGLINLNVETAECTRLPKTVMAARKTSEIARSMEGVSEALTLCGTSNTGGAGENQALVTVVLDDWDRRRGGGLDSFAIAQKLAETNSVLPIAALYPLPPATVPGLGGAVQLYIMSTADSDPIRLADEAHRIGRIISSSPLVARAVCGYTATTPHLRVLVDRAKCELVKVPLATLYATLQHYLGSLYVNDINLGTQVNRVTVEADWNGRAGVEAVKDVFVRSTTGAMVPVGSLVSFEEEIGPRVCYRYNKFVYCGTTIIPSEGVSTREVIDETVRILDRELPSGFAYAWGSLTFYEMRGSGNTPLISLIAAFIVYLILVGRFNSCRGPFAALLPAAGVVCAAILGLYLCDVPVSVHSRMAILLLAVLAVKGAVLMMESDNPSHTAFILFSIAVACALCALPLALSSGAGRNALHAVGAAVCFGALGLAASVPVLVPGLCALFSGRRREGGGALACLLLLFLPFAAAAGNASPPAKESFDLYLLIGQSNMAGRGYLTPTNRVPCEGVYKFDGSGVWRAADEPLHCDKHSSGAGLGASFANAMLGDARPGTAIGLIPCAFGGTSLGLWMPGEWLYENAVLKARHAMRRGTLKGILWHQGEADCSKGKSATYAKRFETMIGSMRRDLGCPDVPVVVGELGRFLADWPGKDGMADHFAAVNGQLHSLTGRVAGCACVSSEGLTHRGDTLHFSTESLRILGERYAAEMRRLQKKGVVE